MNIELKRANTRGERSGVRGFSLVELSIVLVILGLLVGGILAGKSLIKASQLRAVMTEHDRYKTAVFAFRDKYFELPGDFMRAHYIWGDQATGVSSCATGATPDGTPGTCSGDGSGFIGNGSSSSNEGLRAWQHLAFAGLIEGNYLGYDEPVGGGKITIGLNVPASKLPNSGWGLFARLGGSAVWTKTGNFLQFGSELASNLWGAASLIPEEAWNIDSKMDDGKPETGIVMLGAPDTCATPNGAESDTPTGSRAYSIANATITCRMWFKLF